MSPNRQDPHDDDHLDEETEERFGEIARAIQEYMRDGEELLIRSEDDGISIEPHKSPNRFRILYPKMYGRLASISTQMNLGCMPTFIAWFVGLAWIFVINSSWGDLLDEQFVEPMRSWWFYGLLLVGLTLGSFSLLGVHKARVYRRNRTELIRVMQAEHFDRDLLVALVEDLPNLEHVVKQMKLDREPFPALPDERA